MRYQSTSLPFGPSWVQGCAIMSRGDGVGIATLATISGRFAGDGDIARHVRGVSHKYTREKLGKRGKGRGRATVLQDGLLCVARVVVCLLLVRRLGRVAVSGAPQPPRRRWLLGIGRRHHPLGGGSAMSFGIPRCKPFLVNRLPPNS